MLLKRSDFSNRLDGSKTKDVKKSKSKNKEEKEKREILRNLSKYAKGVYNSNNYNHRYQCLQKIRRLVSLQQITTAIIECVINTGIIPQLIHILHLNSTPKLQYESLWILTNISFGNTKQTRIVVKYNIVPSLKRMLISNNTNYKIKSQAMWCLGNIVGDSPFLRNVMFIKYNMLNDIMIPIFVSNKSDIINTDKIDEDKLNLLRESAWTLCNFCRKASKKLFFENKSVIINLFEFLLNTNDAKILNNILWAIHYFVENRNDKRCKLIIDEIINNGMILKMINILILKNKTKDTENICFVALRIMSYIISIEHYDTNKWTLKFIELGIFEKFEKMLNNKIDTTTDINYKRKRKVICFLISNMVANNDRFEEIINSLNDNNLFIPIMKMFKCSPFPIRRESAYIIINIIANCDTLKKVDYVYKSGLIIPSLFKLFRYKDMNEFSNKFGVAILESIQHLLELSEKYNNYKHLYYTLKCSGIDILESMQHHYDENIKNEYKDEYFGVFEEKIKEIIKLIRDQQNKQLLLVKCCSNRCNVTKYAVVILDCSVNDGIESSSAVSSESNCSRIKKHKFFRCKNCISTVYCSKRCQKWHWKNGHKSTCNILSSKS